MLSSEVQVVLATSVYRSTELLVIWYTVHYNRFLLILNSVELEESLGNTQTQLAKSRARQRRTLNVKINVSFGFERYLHYEVMPGVQLRGTRRRNGATKNDRDPTPYMRHGTADDFTIPQTQYIAFLAE